MASGFLVKEILTNKKMDGLKTLLITRCRVVIMPVLCRHQNGRSVVIGVVSGVINSKKYTNKSGCIQNN